VLVHGHQTKVMDFVVWIVLPCSQKERDTS